MFDTLPRSAPRLPAGPGSLTAKFARLVDASKPTRVERLKAMLREHIEPWYNWGRAGISSVRDETSGDGWFFEIDWLGMHLSLTFGRTPKTVQA